MTNFIYFINCNFVNYKFLNFNFVNSSVVNYNFVKTYYSYKNGSEFCEPDWARGRHDPDVDEDVWEVEDDKGSHESEAVVRSTQINWIKMKGFMLQLLRRYMQKW